MAIKICIDAGHYKGYNPGVIKGYYEGNQMWLWQKHITKYLKEYGFQVSNTRTDVSKDLALTSRGAKAKGYDLFLSGHTNAVGTESVDRVVIIEGTASNRKLSELLGSSISKTMGITSKHQVMQKKQSNGDEYYGVLRGAKSVGCLNRYIIEHSFHTNKKACNWLMVESNIEKVAKTEADAIAKFYGVSKPNNDQTQGNGSTTSKNGVYRLVCGSFKDKSNAIKEQEKLKSKGVNAFIMYTEGI